MFLVNGGKCELKIKFKNQSQFDQVKNIIN